MAEGKTIVLSIHQPSSDVYRLLDDLVLLSKGRVLFAGEANQAKGYFAALGYACPEAGLQGILKESACWEGLVNGEGGVLEGKIGGKL